MIKTFFLVTIFSLSCMGCASSSRSNPFLSNFIASTPTPHKSFVDSVSAPPDLSAPYKKAALLPPLSLKQELDQLTEKSQNRQEETNRKIKKNLEARKKLNQLKIENKQENQDKRSVNIENPFLLANRFKNEKKHQANFLKNEQLNEKKHKFLDKKRRKLLISQVCLDLEDKQHRQIILSDNQKKTAAECLLKKELDQSPLSFHSKKIIKERVKTEQNNISK